MSQKIIREVLKDVPLFHVKPYEKNYQDHSKNIEHIMNSINDFGYNKVSISVDENMVVLAGHGTLSALEKLGYKQIPFVLKISGLLEVEKRAYRIADNESAKAVTINDEFLRFEIDEIGAEFDLEDYGFDLPEFNNMDIEDEIKEKELDENIETKNECPSCGYKW